MKKKLAGVFALILAATLLAGCVLKDNPDPSSQSIPESSSASQSPSTPSSSSQSEPEVSKPLSSGGLSYDMDSWEWIRHEITSDLGRIALSLPEGLTINNDAHIWFTAETASAIPASVYGPTEALLAATSGFKWGDVYLTPFSGYTENPDGTIAVDDLDGGKIFHLDDGPVLKDQTFYYYEDYLSYTFLTFPGPTGEPLMETSYHRDIDENTKLLIWFFSFVDATEAKPLFERIVSSVEVLEVFPPQ